jgi:hypothetical protein
MYFINMYMCVLILLQINLALILHMRNLKKKDFEGLNKFTQITEYSSQYLN